jgi:hypothetical protein
MKADKGNGSADNIRAGGSYSPRKKAEDMTEPTTRATPKITLDQRATSRHDSALGSYVPSNRRAIGDLTDMFNFPIH